jgi:hypothetical protein
MHMQVIVHCLLDTIALRPPERRRITAVCDYLLSILSLSAFPKSIQVLLD